MSHRLLVRAAIAAIVILSPLLRAAAQESTPTAPASPTTEPALPPAVVECNALVEKINAKLEAGKSTEADLADEIKAFDALLAKYADQKTEALANIALKRVGLYLQVFENLPKSIELLKQLKTDFPGTQTAQHVDEIIGSLEAKLAATAKLAIGATFEDFAEKDLAGQPLSLASHKGKIVLVDFWATWCGPCVAELPNVLAAYQKYHDKGFEIVGISLDQDQEKLTSFLKAKGMTWAQYFDGKGWENKLAQHYGIESIPATFLLDGEGRIIAKDLRGNALSAKLAELLK